MVREYDWASVSPSFGVIDAIARYEGIETRRMADQLPTLQNTVDTDALNTFVTKSANSELSFAYADYLVHILDETIAISHVSPAHYTEF